MKKIALIITCVLLSSVAFQSCKQSDQSLNNDVEKVLKDNYPSISATTNDGVVTLTGTVDTPEAKNVVGESVRSVNNVKSVVNNIRVREMTPAAPVASPDATIKTDIVAKLQSAGFNDVQVEVNNGEVILSGNLNRSDLTRVMQIANEARPSRVTNNLNLR